MAGGGCFRCLRFLVLRWEYKKHWRALNQDLKIFMLQNQLNSNWNVPTILSVSLIVPWKGWCLIWTWCLCLVQSFIEIEESLFNVNSSWPWQSLANVTQHHCIDGPKKRTANRKFEYTLYTIQCQCWSQPKYVKLCHVARTPSTILILQKIARPTWKIAEPCQTMLQCQPRLPWATLS